MGVSIREFILRGAIGGEGIDNGTRALCDNL
jgi:hypothetical protein